MTAKESGNDSYTDNKSQNGDAVNSPAEHSLDDDYMPLTEKYDAGWRQKRKQTDYTTL